MSKSVSRLLIAASIVLLSLWGCAAKVDDGESVLFNTEISEDATPAVLKRIMAAGKNSISEIKFEKGTYHFYPDKGLEFFVHISNHNDEVIRTAFPLSNLENLVIDGQGSEFIFHGRMIPFLIDHCKNISVKNLSVDWATPFHSEGLIVAVDEKNKTFDLQISKEYPYVIRNEQIIFIKEYYEHNAGQAIMYNPERKAIAFGTELHTPLTSIHGVKVQTFTDEIKPKYEIDPRDPIESINTLENSLRVEEIEPGLVRFYNHRKKLPRKGMVLVMKGDQGANRLAPAFRVTFTDGFYANNVNVHHAGGMGIIAENSSDLILDSFNVTPSHGRMVSTTADATHFVGCRGKVELKNCTFNNQLDDASNVHGTYQKIVDVLGENTLGIRMGHFQQQGFVIGRVGDSIGLVRLSKSFFPYEKLTLKSVQKINSRYQILTFNEKIPASIQQGDLIENLDAYPEFLVENCNISRNRARGLLLSTPKKTVIKNNFFSTEMEALLIPVESGHWYESGSAIDLTITNNKFQDCNHSGYDRGMIRFETDDDNQNIAFKNVEISNNEINHYDNLFLEISNTKGLVFKNNVITCSGTFPKLYPNHPAIHIKSSEDIVFEHNKYQGDATEMIETEGDMSMLEFK
ncbi:alpha-1,3-galactosidase-related protein [Labilibacter marinus]|uniref:alpha-1,3-galactosidase-related protein n=1 Tax=Labilibacter marinus TaxID=1477105 RepID=UPI00094F5A8A|nr:right-handed parallel beta-helix repeat-containing protein [Labilibacter marinus]